MVTEALSALVLTFEPRYWRQPPTLVIALRTAETALDGCHPSIQPENISSLAHGEEAGVLAAVATDGNVQVAPGEVY